MNIADAIALLDREVPDPSRGLPEALFFYISRTTPLVNVDLLIKDENGRVLLAWRDDPYSGNGWHIPGGIVRFKETLEQRVNKVAETEIGTLVEFNPVPIAVKQCIHHEREIRSHFISILYQCSLPSSFMPENKGLSEGDAGYLQWHEQCPEHLLKCHEMYRNYL
ncbi:MAG TPA: NUDIX domain-containing protein [Candidatus Omnitrophota bacterium]|nr:NUDIX domain-containing protein [Candidatus Omnitrophota bacterium]